MMDVVVLSDSSESVLSIESNDKQDNIETGTKKHSIDNFDLTNFEFPAVQFHYDENKAVESQTTKISSLIFDTHASPSHNNEKYTVVNKNSRQNNEKISHKFIHSSDSEKDSDEEKRNTEKSKKVKVTRKKDKNQASEERLRKQEQLAREKGLKSIAAKKLKNLKPGECMKFMEVVFDKGIENFAPITEIVNTLTDTCLQYSINTELIPNSVTWKRSIENSYVTETNEICTIRNIEKIDQMLLIWNWDETVMKVSDGSFTTSIYSIKSLVSDTKIILVIFGMENYFVRKKQGRNTGKGRKNQVEDNHNFKNYPEISRRQLETCLNEIQIVAGCSSRLINNFQDLGLMVYQCTKAIAETPYKLEKEKNLTTKFDWYVTGDNKDTVRIDKDGNGLKRLWQQQLCQFNLSSLEIAEAICSVYPSPANLIEAYTNRMEDDGMNLLKDIPIRRAAGPLTAIRRVGLELSKKVYLMFASRDGETILS